MQPLDENVASLIRDALKIVGTMAIAKGLGDTAAWEMIGGGVLAIAGIMWSQVFHYTTKPPTS